MAQKAFMADAGIRLGEWSIVELGNGDMQVSNMHTISGSQKAFRVDKGLRIGDWRMTVDGNGDMVLSETAIAGSQRPFIADAGVKIGAWTLHPTVDGDLYAEKNAVIVNYTLSCDYSAVNEGGSVTITLATTGVATGTTVPYTITGVTSADIDGASLTGNFVTGTTDSVTLNITADSSTEGTETLQLALDNGNSSKSVTINDTSQTAANPTYSVSHNAGSSVNEGSQVTFTLTTTNVADGTTLYYTTSYSNANGGNTTSSDFTGANAGPVTVNNNSASFTVTIDADTTTEAGQEYFFGNFGTSYSYVDILATSSIIQINDTSQNAGPSEPSVGTWLYGGETIAPGWWESHWNGSNTLTVKFDTSSTSTAGWGTSNDDWEWVLDDWAAGNGSGDTIEIRGDGGLRVLTINGSVTKTQIGSSDTYYYAIPVAVTTGTMSSSAGYIVTPLYLQHQHNG